MSPSNLINCGDGNIKISSNGAPYFTGVQTAFNLSDIDLRQFCTRQRISPGYSSTLDGVVGVLLRGACAKMPWVYTLGVIARMQNEQTFWNGRIVVHLPRDNMSSLGFSSNTNATVPTGRKKGAIPLPTARFSNHYMSEKLTPRTAIARSAPRWLKRFATEATRARINASSMPNHEMADDLICGRPQVVSG